eukprot:2127561-Pleurochrysis_carterae.AAC.1
MARLAHAVEGFCTLHVTACDWLHSDHLIVDLELGETNKSFVAGKRVVQVLAKWYCLFTALILRQAGGQSRARLLWRPGKVGAPNLAVGDSSP